MPRPEKPLPTIAMSWSAVISYGTVTSTTMSSAANTRMSAEARREHLLDAAKAVVAGQGFHAVSIEAVARAAGITRPIVYRHFGDLAELLDALVDRETKRALAQLQELPAARTSAATIRDPTCSPRSTATCAPSATTR